MLFADTSAKKNPRRAQLHSRLPAREWNFDIYRLLSRGKVSKILHRDWLPKQELTSVSIKNVMLLMSNSKSFIHQACLITGWPLALVLFFVYVFDGVSFHKQVKRILTSTQPSWLHVCSTRRLSFPIGETLKYCENPNPSPLKSYKIATDST